MQNGNRKQRNMMLTFVYIVSLFICFYLITCTPSSENQGPDTTKHFDKIYDTADAYNYTAVDIKQTQNGGYIILAEVDGHPYLLKVDDSGDFLWATDPQIFDDYINPIPNLLIFNGNYYFFCNKISGTDYIPVLLKFSGNIDTHEEVTFADDLFVVASPKVLDKHRTIFPLHASTTAGEKILLLVFDEPNTRILLRIMDFKGGRILKGGHDNHIQDICGIEFPVLDKRLHFTFFNSSESNFSYFQSFGRRAIYLKKNVCFRIVSINPEDWLYFDQYPQKIPFIAIDLAKSGPEGDKFSFARIDNNIVTFFVNTDLFDIDEKEGHPQYESNEAKPVYIKTILVKGRKVVFFASTVKTGRIVVALFDLSERRFLHNYYIGKENPYEAAGLIGTKDGGLAVLGTTFFLNRINRICLFKLSKEDLEEDLEDKCKF